MLPASRACERMRVTHCQSHCQAQETENDAQATEKILSVDCGDFISCFLQ